MLKRSSIGSSAAVAAPGGIVNVGGIQGSGSNAGSSVSASPSPHLQQAQITVPQPVNAMVSGLGSSSPAIPSALGTGSVNAAGVNVGSGADQF
ncbi:unnamed protein product [Ambrosiozyma monospora]|uniref:Unnamed protein product n=1 Tax=Ambrosiozyma monospora TaxID=43982 RepID=A0A9W6WDT3_AMBMO|nr:unnamed protein product [Ambrosiozyma monospora]